MDTCRSCGEPLVWALTANGKPAPVTRAPRENGNVLVFRDHAGELRSIVPPEEVRRYLREAGVPLRLNHFADCPQAARFRS